MDGELKNMKLNINQLAALSGLHRQTVAARMADVPLAPGSNEKKKLYLLTDLIISLLEKPPTSEDEEMNPHDRKAWYQSERERLKFEQETAQLIPADDVRKEMAIWGEIVSEELAKLPNILARDAGLKPMAVNRVQSIIDDLCNQIISRMVKNDVVNEVAKQA
ncbi:DUF1441 family protein [Escherichia coli]|uniref:DUF1441 family protein n=5 Tax=Escherichia coli TaxID=562 RepID=UPI003078CDC0